MTSPPLAPASSTPLSLVCAPFMMTLVRETALAATGAVTAHLCQQAKHGHYSFQLCGPLSDSRSFVHACDHIMLDLDDELLCTGPL